MTSRPNLDWNAVSVVHWGSSRSRETGESDDGEQEYRSSSSDDSERRTDAYRTTADIETDIVGKLTIAQARERYDRSADDGEIRKLMQMEEKWGPQVHHWVAEGVPTDAMKSRVTRERFRERRDTPIPWNVEKDNKKSLQRSREATEEIEPAGRTNVPDTVREVISSPGQSLDASIQRAVEERMGDSLGDVRIHTGPRAAAAADAIDARAFTVGNHVAFGAGEYDPESAEGQHVLAHELAHVRQQTGGALSMLPQEGVQLEIDPDPELEREAEETARRVMSGGELGIQRLSDTDVHVQRTDNSGRTAALAGNLERTSELQDRVSELKSTVTDNTQRIDSLEETVETAAEVPDLTELDAELSTDDGVVPDEIVKILAELNKSAAGLGGSAMVTAGITSGNPVLTGAGLTVALGGPVGIDALARDATEDESVELSGEFLDPLADAVAERLEQRRTHKDTQGRQ